MYQKDFDVWNVKKKILDNDFEGPYFHQKEIWFCYLGQKFYYAFNFVDEIESVAMLSQIRLIDAKRLARKIGFTKEKDFEAIIEKLKGLMP